jgi:hypothetical protein
LQAQEFLNKQISLQHDIIGVSKSFQRACPHNLELLLTFCSKSRRVTVRAVIFIALIRHGFFCGDRNSYPLLAKKKPGVNQCGAEGENRHLEYIAPRDGARVRGGRFNGLATVKVDD